MAIFNSKLLVYQRVFIMVFTTSCHKLPLSICHSIQLMLGAVLPAHFSARRNCAPAPSPRSKLRSRKAGMAPRTTRCCGKPHGRMLPLPNHPKPQIQILPVLK